MFEAFYQQKRADAVRASYEESAADIAGILDSRQTYAERASAILDYDEIRRVMLAPNLAEDARLLANALIVALMKDPLKQNLCEKTQIEFLRANGVSIRKLGNRELFVSNGQVGPARGDAKSVDAIISIRGTDYPTCKKYTKESGGAQDNQLADVKTFMSAAAACDGAFIALLDGPYYRNKFSKIKSKNVYILTSDQLVEMNNLGQTPDEYADRKKTYGQFYTTNWETILAGLRVPAGVPVVEPFAGAGDLLYFIRKYTEHVALHDIDPKIDGCDRRDTLRDLAWITPDCYVVTNPPYLAKNKNTDKSAYSRGTDDLYKEFIDILAETDDVAGGVLIVPLNFLTCRSPADIRLRGRFFDKYEITAMNIFEVSVFADTDYTVISFEFARGITRQIPAVTVPSGGHILLDVDNADRMFGAEMHARQKAGRYRIGRLTAKTPTSATPHTTRLYLSAIDTGSPEGRIKLTIHDPYIGKTSDRSFATLTCNERLAAWKEEMLVIYFNRYIERSRAKYHSLFLNSYRNSTEHYTRKRISFDMAYAIIEDALAGIDSARYDEELALRIRQMNGDEFTIADALNTQGINWFDAWRTACKLAIS